MSGKFSRAASGQPPSISTAQLVQKLRPSSEGEVLGKTGDINAFAGGEEQYGNNLFATTKSGGMLMIMVVCELVVIYIYIAYA